MILNKETPRQLYPDPRPSKLVRVIIELEVVAQWSTCQRGRVGSALVNIDGVILVPARNGTPYGMPDCSTYQSSDSKCMFCVHSERNVINHAARLGVQTQGHQLITLRRPCIDCANDIVQAGIGAVYYREPYYTDENMDGLVYVKNLFSNASIHFEQLATTRQEEMFSNMLREWRSTWTITS